MRALLPDPVNDQDLHEFYAADWLDRGGLRVNMLASADGAATAAGLSEGLQTPGDNRVFAALRDLADVVVVGAATAVAEGYRPITPDADRLAVRERFGLAPVTPIALVSRSLRFDTELVLFAQPGPRAIVYTSAATDPEARRRIEAVAEVVVCGDSEVDLVAVRADLATRGLRRTLCEGGPRLFAALTTAGAVDELCLSISPMLAGPGSFRIVNGAPWATPLDGLVLTGLLEEDGALFARYRTPAG